MVLYIHVISCFISFIGCDKSCWAVSLSVSNKVLMLWNDSVMPDKPSAEPLKEQPVSSTAGIINTFRGRTLLVLSLIWSKNFEILAEGLKAP